MDACSRFIGVGRWTFVFRQWHKFHPTFRTIAGMIGYDLGMHRAGVFLRLFLLACHAVAKRRRVLAVWATEVNRTYLCADAYSECEYAN